MDQRPQFRAIREQLLQSDTIFIVAHPRCGDALGATLAMALWLKSEGKAYTAFSAAEVPKELSFLPRVHEIVTNPEAINLGNFDTLLILDSGDIGMTGIAEQIEHVRGEQSVVIINIDHHITNTGYGNLAVVDKRAASTTRLLYDFFRTNDIPITRDIATCLLVGILFDTGMFSNAATDSESLATAAHLVSLGSSLPTIVQFLVQNKSIDLLRLWGMVLSRLEHREDLGIVYTAIVEDDMRDLKLEAGAGDLANFLNNLGEGKFVMILKQGNDGLVKVSLRTTRDDVDVARFASFFGGGGHKKSAGFAFPGTLLYNEHTNSFEIK